MQQRRCAGVVRSSAKHNDVSIRGRAGGTSALRQGGITVRPRSNVGLFHEGVTGNEHSEAIKTSKAITAHFLRTICGRKQEVTWLCATVRLLGGSSCTEGLQNVTKGVMKLAV